MTDGNVEDGGNEVESDEVLYARIMAAPTPAGPRPTDHAVACEALARRMLEFLATHDGEVPRDLWRAAKCDGAFDKWIGFATSFMVGWATNTARRLHGLKLLPNPAMFEVSQP